MGVQTLSAVFQTPRHDPHENTSLLERVDMAFKAFVPAAGYVTGRFTAIAILDDARRVGHSLIWSDMKLPKGTLLTPNFDHLSGGFKALKEPTLVRELQEVAQNLKPASVLKTSRVSYLKAADLILSGKSSRVVNLSSFPNEFHAYDYRPSPIGRRLIPLSGMAAGALMGAVMGTLWAKDRFLALGMDYQQAQLTASLVGAGSGLVSGALSVMLPGPIGFLAGWGASILLEEAAVKFAASR